MLLSCDCPYGNFSGPRDKQVYESLCNAKGADVASSIKSRLRTNQELLFGKMAGGES